jgi:hypothetical protein
MVWGAWRQGAGSTQRRVVQGRAIPQHRWARGGLAKCGWCRVCVPLLALGCRRLGRAPCVAVFVSVCAVRGWVPVPVVLGLVLLLVCVWVWCAGRGRALHCCFLFPCGACTYSNSPLRIVFLCVPPEQVRVRSFHALGVRKPLPPSLCVDVRAHLFIVPALLWWCVRVRWHPGPCLAV